MATRILLWLMVFWSAFAAAKDADCQFIQRKMVGLILSQMPDEVIGLATCYNKFPNTNAFIVARLADAKKDSLKALRVDLAQLAGLGAGRTYVVIENTDAGADYQVLQSETGTPSKPMWHFTFTEADTDGSTLVYFHSANKKDTQTVLPTLKMLRRELASAGFIKQMHGPPPKLAQIGN